MAERTFPSNNGTPPVATQTPQSTQSRVDSAVASGAKVHSPDALDGAAAFFNFNRPSTFGDWVSLVADLTNRFYSAFDTLVGKRAAARPGQPGVAVPAARVAYSQMYDQQNAPAKTANPGANFEYIEYPDRGTAEVVLASMRELLQGYKNVSIGDMYDLSGITDPKGYVNHKYGWRDLSTARVIEIAHGRYMIALPAAIPL